MANVNPLELQIVEVVIQKFNKSEKLIITPQFIELTLFQSIFEPVIKAEMVLNDNIGLFVNWPFTGEEIFSISYKQLSAADASTTIQKTIDFICRGVRKIIVDDRARSMMYIVDLCSVEFLQNTRKYVSHAYNDKIEDAAEKLYNEYISDDTQKQFQKPLKPFIKEESQKVRSIIIPNLRPFQAIQWLAKHAVAKDYDKHYLYLFYEDLDQFNFVTIQQLIEDASKNRQQLMSQKYIYSSDIESSFSSPAKAGANADPETNLRVITNLVINKRFSSIEKIASGYFQNELFEISMLQKSYNSTPTELMPDESSISLEPNPLNTTEYINYVKNDKENTEYSNRIRYIINNYEDSDSQNKSNPEYRLKIGPSIKYLIALNQVDFTITVPANMGLKAGDVIFVSLPENHGFNQVQIDKYATGLFIVSEVKQVINSGNRAATSLRIYKDGYLNRLSETSLYNKGAVRSGDIIVNPSTGRPIGTV
jgi:hypothetical protein